MPEAAAYRARVEAALADAARARKAGGTLGVRKGTSNLFRDRDGAPKRLLDLSAFDHVIDVDAGAGWVDVEGLTTYEALVDATLPHGVMPAVVPQLKTITVGGAIAGVGIEATSFRQGLVHDTMLELDVLQPDGRVVTATPDNEHADLFHAFPNSYGTLGYALRARVRTLPVKRYIHVQHRRYADLAAYFDAVNAACEGDADFVDGVVFDASTLVLSTARFSDDAPAASDYTYRNIYYRSLLTRDEDWLTTYDYLWRWDTDWFWCSKNLGAQNPLVRTLFGRSRLNSRTYTKLMRWNSRVGLTRALTRWSGRSPESIIQDLDVPLAHAPEFLRFLLDHIGILPIWICPIRPAPAGAGFTVYPMTPGVRYVNLGLWDVKRTDETYERGHFNRMIEAEVMRLGGIKSLYSDSYFSREAFAQAYNLAGYEAVKARVDPAHAALGLYEKCVLRR